VNAALLQNVSTVASAAASAAPSVFLNDCSQAHPIVVEELNNGRHEVILHAGNQVIGISQPVVAYDASVSGTTAVTPLGLFTPPTTVIGPATVNDVFALDGDSIILASSRCIDLSVCLPPPTQLVVQLQNGRSDNGTPLVVAPRNLADSEFWDFLAADHSGAYPTTGFWTVSNAGDLFNLVNQLAQQNNGTAWGNVIIVKNGDTCPGSVAGEPATDWAGNPIPQCINLTGYVNNGVSLQIPTGVTIRGDRRGTNPGPLLLGQYYPSVYTWMMKTGSYVRITGLRLEGPTGSTAVWQPKGTVQGILIESPATEVIVDHNELFAWPQGSIVPDGALYFTNPLWDCTTGGRPVNVNPDSTLTFLPIASLDSSHIERNFIHDNAANPEGYGVIIASGGASTIIGNTFRYNRHAIASDGIPSDQYSALDNLVLSDSPSYDGNYEQDFDMHGVGYDGYGGWAGYNVQIAWNTFLGGNRYNFALRGEPCHAPDSFHNNVSERDQSDAIFQADFNNNQYKHVTASNLDLTLENNQFSDSSPAYRDPTITLGVGDFDGDGIQDLFLATGATWFYSPGSVAEWRYLNGGKTDRMQTLLLGDFDGDGRTDVVGINGNTLMVSWGGISDWQVLNTLPAGASIADLAVGDFNGDGHADILYTTGAYWYVSSGGSGPFNYVNKSSFRVPNLRFGHFSICGSNKETDVFGIVSGKWQVTCGAVGDWQRLPVSLTDSLANLYIADFNGDGNADIAQFYSTTYEGNYFTSLTWRFSYGATQGWVSHTILPTNSCPAFGSLELGTPLDPPLVVAGIGSFDANPGADLYWHQALHRFRRYWRGSAPKPAGDALSDPTSCRMPKPKQELSRSFQAFGGRIGYPVRPSPFCG
jgi:hypothetical protein